MVHSGMFLEGIGKAEVAAWLAHPFLDLSPEAQHELSQLNGRMLLEDFDLEDFQKKCLR